MKRVIGAIVILFFAWTGAPAADVQVWVADPLEKVFRDASFVADSKAVADAARGETATFQIVVKSKDVIAALSCAVTSFAPQHPRARPITMPHVRYVDYVPVDVAIPNPPNDQLRKPPAEFPDPLRELRETAVKADNAQPVWITIKVPLNAIAGTYHSTATIVARTSSGGKRVGVPLTLNVYGAKVERSRLWVTNWYHLSAPPKVKENSPEYWERLRNYVRDMVAHGQNVARVAPLRVVDYADAGGGRLRFDFRAFDQWLRVFSEEGIQRVEGQQFGWRKDAWEGPFVVSTYAMDSGKPKEVRVDPTSLEAERFYSLFFPALQGHLAQLGVLDKYVQHIADEPIDSNAESYVSASKLVRKYAPKLKTIDAGYTTKLVGAIDVWVPHLDTLHHNLEFFKQRQSAGDEVWFYTCVAAQGEYANRFMEQPLIKTRLLHWINAKYGITGYLHWAYNAWTRDPFDDPVDVRDGNFVLPAGESWIVYPNDNGVIDSIRFEAMRDGIADYELLTQLSERDPAAAQALAGRHVLDFDRYETDVAAFRATRHELLERLSQPNLKADTEQ